MLSRRGVKHELLNAKPEYADREAEIVAQADRISGRHHLDQQGRPRHRHHPGRRQSRTRSPGLASRTSTKPDSTSPMMSGNRPSRPSATMNTWKRKDAMSPAWAGCTSSAPNAMSHVASTISCAAERSRQGDPGSSRFFLSLQDDLMRVFHAGEWVANVLSKNSAWPPAKRSRAAWSSRPHRGGSEKGRRAKLRHPQKPPRIRRGHGLPTQARLWLSPGIAQRFQSEDPHLGHAQSASRSRPGSLSRSPLRAPAASPSWWCSSSASK